MNPQGTNLIQLMNATWTRSDNRQHPQPDTISQLMTPNDEHAN